MVSNRHKSFLGLAAFFLIIFGFSATCMGKSVFPPFAFIDPLDGKIVKSDTYVGQPTLLVFFANADELTESNIKMVTLIKGKYADYNLNVAAVCVDRDEAGVLRMLLKHQPSFKILIPKAGWRIEAGESIMPLFILMNRDLGIIKKLEGKKEAKKALLEAIDMHLGITR